MDLIADVQRFESLGNNCELGFVLHAAGAVGGGLFKWTESPPESVLNLIKNDLLGFYQFENLFPFRSGMVWDSACRLGFHSKMISEKSGWIGSTTERMEIYDSELARQSVLAQRFRKRLIDPNVTFVLKDGHQAPEALLDELVSFIESHGGAQTLVVRTTDDPAKVATIEQTRGFFVGYVDRFAPTSDSSQFSPKWVDLLNLYSTVNPLRNELSEETYTIRRKQVSRAIDGSPRQSDASPGANSSIGGAEEMKSAMSASELAYVLALARNAGVVLEFGSGGSTLELARAQIGNLWSVESDPSWIARCLEQREIRDAVDKKRVHLVHADIGQVGEYGYPVDTRAAMKWPNYHAGVWRDMPKPDVVLIDGRFRVACALQAAFRCSPDAVIIMHDYSRRPEYHVIEQVLGNPEVRESIAVFTNPRHLDAALIGRLLTEHFMDSR
jgi:hypothetical protein